jgi:nitroreductase
MPDRTPLSEREVVLDVIYRRRSNGRLVAPAPTSEQLAELVEAASAAPDHGRLRPWRFIEIRPDAYGVLSRLFEERSEHRASVTGVPMTAAERDKARGALGRAPLVVAVAVVLHEHAKVPWPEQLAAGAAATQTLLLAATAAGWGSMWRTGPNAYDPEIKAALGLREEDALIGFVYLGTAPAEQPARRRHAAPAIVRWDGPLRAGDLAVEHHAGPAIAS